MPPAVCCWLCNVSVSFFPFHHIVSAIYCSIFLPIPSYSRVPIIFFLMMCVFVAINSLLLLPGVVENMMVPSLVQTDLFEKYIYYIRILDTIKLYVKYLYQKQ